MVDSFGEVYDYVLTEDQKWKIWQLMIDQKFDGTVEDFIDHVLKYERLRIKLSEQKKFAGIPYAVRFKMLDEGKGI